MTEDQDYAMRFDLCRELQHQIEKEQNFTSKILWTAENTFSNKMLVRPGNLQFPYHFYKN